MDSLFARIAAHFIHCPIPPNRFIAIRPRTNAIILHAIARQLFLQFKHNSRKPLDFFLKILSCWIPDRKLVVVPLKSRHGRNIENGLSFWKLYHRRVANDASEHMMVPPEGRPAHGVVCHFKMGGCVNRDRVSICLWVGWRHSEAGRCHEWAGGIGEEQCSLLSERRAYYIDVNSLKITCVQHAWQGTCIRIKGDLSENGCHCQVSLIHRKHFSCSIRKQEISWFSGVPNQRIFGFTGIKTLASIEALCNLRNSSQLFATLRTSSQPFATLRNSSQLFTTPRNSWQGYTYYAPMIIRRTVMVLWCNMVANLST